MLTLEVVAVILAISYLVLAGREHIACWYFAFASSAIYTVIFWDVSLLMESALNIFYVVMAVVGWFKWSSPANAEEKANVNSMPIRTMKMWQHGAILLVLVLAATANGWFMQQNTTAVWPYLDAFTTWASVVTTFLVVWKILENWLYWLVIDSISIYLYIDRELYLTALLFAAYVIIVIFGYFHWRKLFTLQSAHKLNRSW